MVSVPERRCCSHKAMGWLIGSPRDHQPVWCDEPAAGTWCRIAYCAEHLASLEVFANKNDLGDQIVWFAGKRPAGGDG